MTQPARPAPRSAPLLTLAGVAVALGLGCSGAPPSESPSVSPPSVSPPSVPPPAAAPPDIVLVIVDTLRADHLGFMGHSRPTSPHLDALAAESVVFTRAYAQSGWTLPSVASLLTGLRPHAHKIVRDGKNAARFGRRDPTTPTLACALAGRGYRSAAFINNTFLAPEFGLNAGFDVYDYNGAHNDKHRTAPDTVAAALAWLGQSEQPAFLVVHLMEPHLDYNPPAPQAGRFVPAERPARLAYPAVPNPFSQLQSRAWEADAPERAYLAALYDEEVLTADAAVGALITGLRSRPRAAEGVLAITADHGEELWDMGGFEHGHALWSPLTHVPLLLSAPGLAPARVETVVEHIDLSQTLLAMAGASPAVGAAGQDLRAVMAAPGVPRVALQENCIYGAPCLSVLDGAHRLTVRAGQPEPGITALRPLLSLHALGPTGAETSELGPTSPEAEALIQKLGGYILSVRGSANPILEVPGAELTDGQTFEMLRSLGYVDEAGADRARATDTVDRSACPL
jgi:choline-sulfatase